MSIREDIADNCYRYAWAYDSFDADGFVASFAPDGTLAVVAADGQTRVTGHAALRDFFAKARGHRKKLGQQPRHMIANVVVDATDGKTATAKCYMTLVLTGSDGIAVVDHAGRYLDTLALIEGRWRFTERRILMDRDQNFDGRKAPPKSVVEALGFAPNFSPP